MKPFGEWDLLLAPGLHKWLLFASAAPAFLLTTFFFDNKRLRPFVGGLALGTAALLVQIGHQRRDALRAGLVRAPRLLRRERRRVPLGRAHVARRLEARGLIRAHLARSAADLAPGRATRYRRHATATTANPEGRHCGLRPFHAARSLERLLPQSTSRRPPVCSATAWRAAIRCPTR